VFLQKCFFLLVYRRIFPTLQFSLEGLDKDRYYTICIDMLQLGQSQWKYQSSRWTPTGKAQRQLPSEFRFYITTINVHAKPRSAMSQMCVIKTYTLDSVLTNTYSMLTDNRLGCVVYTLSFVWSSMTAPVGYTTLDSMLNIGSTRASVCITTFWKGLVAFTIL